VTKRKNSGIVFLGEHSSRHIGAILQHGREFEHIEIFPTFADSGLTIEDVMLPCQLENDHKLITNLLYATVSI